MYKGFPGDCRGSSAPRTGDEALLGLQQLDFQGLQLTYRSLQLRLEHLHVT